MGKPHRKICHFSILIAGNYFPQQNKSIQRYDMGIRSDVSLLIRMGQSDLVVDLSGARGTCPISVHYLSFSCSFWQKLCQIIGYHPLGLVPPFGKFSIRHWDSLTWTRCSCVKRIYCYYRFYLEERINDISCFDLIWFQLHLCYLCQTTDSGRCLCKNIFACWFAITTTCSTILHLFSVLIIPHVYKFIWQQSHGVQSLQ